MGDVECKDGKSGGGSFGAFFVDAPVEDDSFLAAFGEESVFPLDAVGARFDLGEGFRPDFCEITGMEESGDGIVVIGEIGWSVAKVSD